MCIEDIRLSRDKSASMRTVGGPSNTAVAGQNRNRTCLIFSANNMGAAEVRIWPQRAGPTFAGGFVININLPTLFVRLDDVGPLLFDTWLANDGGAGVVLTITDITLEKT